MSDWLQILGSINRFWKCFLIAKELNTLRELRIKLWYNRVAVKQWSWVNVGQVCNFLVHFGAQILISIEYLLDFSIVDEDLLEINTARAEVMLLPLNGINCFFCADSELSTFVLGSLLLNTRVK